MAAFSHHTQYPKCNSSDAYAVYVDKSDGYYIITIDRKLYKAHRLAWFISTGRFPEQFIDHINGVRSDNRLCNLREATNIENCRNKSRQRNNTSGTTGVHWFKCRYQCSREYQRCLPKPAF